MIYKLWLMQASALAALDDLHTVEARQAASGHELAARNSTPSVSNGVATIDIKGPLMPERSGLYDFFGIEHTAYSDIVADTRAAETDSSVKSIEYQIDSPGGTVAGMFETSDAIRNAEKPTRAIVTGMAASAAYGLASQADSIEATARTACIGSIGVVTTRFVSDYVVDITSSNAPNKRPDARTEEGRAAIRAELDEIESLFIEGIAEGRNTTASNVEKNYGRGGTMLADNALKNGMIDKILTAAPAGHGKTKTAATVASEKTESIMDLNELKAQHPELYAQVLAMGEAKERDRVSGHLNAAGDIAAAREIALEAITAGDELNSSYYGKYLSAARNDQDVKANNADAPADVDNAAAEADSLNEDTRKADAGKSVASQVSELLGVQIDV